MDLKRLSRPKYIFEIFDRLLGTLKVLQKNCLVSVNLKISNENQLEKRLAFSFSSLTFKKKEKRTFFLTSHM